MDFKKLISDIVPILIALVIYDMVVKGLLAKVNGYDDSLDGLEGKDHFEKI